MPPICKPSVIALLLASGPLYAAGYQLSEQSATGLGRAFAGDAAIADNASVLGRNPGAITRFDRPTFSGGVIYIQPKVDIAGHISNHLTGEVQSAAANDIAQDAWVPNFYWVTPLNDRLSLGLSLASYYGLGVKMPGNYNASLFGDIAEIKTVDAGLALAYQLTPCLSLGAGLSVIYGEGEVGGSLKLANDTVVNHVQGDGTAMGWNVGMLLTPTEQTRIGLSYRNQVDLKLKGDAINANQPDTGHLILTLPATAELALFHKLTDTLAMHGSISWSDWSKFAGINAILDSGNTMPFDNGYMKDSWRYAIGVTYQLAPRWQLRSGVAYDQTPIPASQRTITIPDSDRYWYSLGVGYLYSSALSVDLGLTLLDGQRVDVDKTKYFATLNGASEGDAWLAGLQLNYRF